MLYIVQRRVLPHYEQPVDVETTWHVGEQAPQGIMIDSVVEVQADEDELIYLLTHFNLPVCSHKRSIRWFGDMAKFIVANLV